MLLYRLTINNLLPALVWKAIEEGTSKMLRELKAQLRDLNQG